MAGESLRAGQQAVRPATTMRYAARLRPAACAGPLGVFRLAGNHAGAAVQLVPARDLSLQPRWSMAMPIGDKTTWRIGYDSTVPENIPRDAEFIFPYVPPSRYAWSAAEIAMFPHAAVAHITVHGEEPDWRNASIIDVEGDRSDPSSFSFTPEQARWFVHKRNEFRPGTATVYCNRDKLPLVQKACEGLHWWLWLAQPDGHPGIVPPYANCVAKQFNWVGMYDQSVIYDPGWHPKGTRRP